MKLIITIIFVVVAIVFFAVALHFSQYKKRKSGCCCGADLTAGYSGKTCGEDESKSCGCE